MDGACDTYGGKERCARGFGQKCEGKSHWGDQDIDWSIVLRWLFRKWEGYVGTGWSWLRIGRDGGRLRVL